ncbi:uncharacterized protein LOC122466241 isoform X2 [Chelonia mydas]|uniref:uncharacterized protein LOC122466241 isoform X2 n=1 Tax=Chelonia mydas TaxID=8469 RepID=UPI001CAA03AF|nr:uncharacterized protein LOC122466241 isoform X2 [Chelonia mydas]
MPSMFSAMAQATICCRPAPAWRRQKMLISWACVERRLYSQSSNPAVETWTSTSRLLGGCRRRATTGTSSYAMRKPRSCSRQTRRPERPSMNPEPSLRPAAFTEPSAETAPLDTSEEPKSHGPAMNSEEEKVDKEVEEEYGGQMTRGSSCTVSQDLFWTPVQVQPFAHGQARCRGRNLRCRMFFVMCSTDIEVMCGCVPPIETKNRGNT